MPVKHLQINFSPKTQPLAHQIEAIEYVKTHDIVPLFDEQGLGKTKMIIDALNANIQQKRIDSILVICKKTLLKNWNDEVVKHSYLFPVILTGSKNQKGRSLLTYGHYYIANYEAVVSEIELLKLMMRDRKFAIVLDESHRIKNPYSKAAEAIFSLKDLSVKRIIISGTPIANKPEDIWSQFYFLDGGITFGEDYEAFKKEYSVDLRGRDDFSGYNEKMEYLNGKINEVSIRRTKEILQLPDKEFIDVYVDLPDEHQRVYDVIKRELTVEIESIDGNDLLSNIDNYLVKLLRLTQVASNPRLLFENFTQESGKIIALDTLVKSIIERDEKAIIWTSFRKKELKGRYSIHGTRTLFGEMSIDDRNRSVKDFLTRPDVRLLIANPSAAKEGLTLTSANNAIYLDRTFKMDDYLQSQDRIHRISQTRKCSIYKIIAKNTIDLYTDEILEKKETLAKYILGDTNSLEMKSKCLTKDDLIRIMG